MKNGALTYLRTENCHLKSHLHRRYSFEIGVVILSRFAIGKVSLNTVYFLRVLRTHRDDNQRGR